MKVNDVVDGGKLDFTGIDRRYFLIGLLSAFDNRFQAMADKAMGEVSWKQFFAVVCIDMCKKPPTIKELADIMGSSHQNVKQILLKLEKKGFVSLVADERDRRKQRIELTEYCRKFCADNQGMSSLMMNNMFAGISDEELKITIQTIMQMESNLMADLEEENEREKR